MFIACISDLHWQTASQFLHLLVADHCVPRGSSNIWCILISWQLSIVPIALFLKFRSPLFFHRITDNLTCHNWGDGNYVRGLQHLQLLSAAQSHSLSLSLSFSLVSHLFFTLSILATPDLLKIKFGFWEFEEFLTKRWIVAVQIIHGKHFRQAKFSWVVLRFSPKIILLS